MTHDTIRTDGGTETTTDVQFETATDLDGQVALVAGGTAGIGKATATRLADMGATTVVVGSTPERGEAAVDDITTTTGNDVVEYRQADFSRMAEVEELAAWFRDSYDRLDVLVLTVGIVPHEQEMTDEGIERSFAINYLSRFLLTNRLVDLLEANAPGRVVNVAAAGQNPPSLIDLDDLEGDRLFQDPEETDYMVQGEGALRQAQTANDVFSYELAERLEGDGVSVTVVNPGAVDTDIRQRASEGWQQVDEMLRSEMGVVPPETVAETTIPLATVTDPAAVTGRFFETGREEVDIPEDVRETELRQALWERSAELSGLADTD